MKANLAHKDPNILFSVFQFLIRQRMKLARQKMLLYVQQQQEQVPMYIYRLIIEAEPVVSVLHLFLCDEHKQLHDTTSLQFQQWCCSAKMAAMFVWSVLYGHCDKTKRCYNKAKIRRRAGVYSGITPSYNYAIRLLHLFPLKTCFNRMPLF